MRSLFFILLTMLSAQAAVAEQFCSAQAHGDQWEVSAGSQSYSLKTDVFLVVPETAKVRFAQFQQYIGYRYVAGGNAEFNYRSEGDIYFRTQSLAVDNSGSWVSLVAVLNTQAKQLHVAFREPGGAIFANTPLGDEMTSGVPTQFGILKAAQAAKLQQRLEKGEPFDVLLVTNDAIFAEKVAFTYPEFAVAKAAADALLEDLKAKAAIGDCM